MGGVFRRVPGLRLVLFFLRSPAQLMEIFRWTADCPPRSLENFPSKGVFSDEAVKSLPRAFALSPKTPPIVSYFIKRSQFLSRLPFDRH